MLNRFNIFKKLDENKEIQKDLRTSYSIKFIITILTVVICSMFYILRIHNDFTNISSDIPTKGFIWTGEDIIADYSFPIKRSAEEYGEDLRNISKNSYMIFEKKINVESSEKKKLDNILIKYRNDNPNLNASKTSIVNQSVRGFLENIYRNVFINIELDDLSNLAVYSNYENKRSLVPYEYIYDLDRVKQKYKLLNLNQIDEKLSNVIYNELISTLKANHFINKNLTDIELDILKSSVPKTNGFVSEGEILIKKGDKISDDHILKLQSYRSSLFEIETQDNKFLVYIGSIGHFLLVFSFLLIYIFKLKQDEFYDNVKYSLLCSFLIIIAALSYISISINYNYPMEYFITIPAFSMLAVMIFDFRTSFYMTVTMSLMAAGIRGNDYAIGISMMFAGILSIYSIRNIKERSQLYKSILFIFLGYFLSLVFLGLERSISAEELIQSTAFAAINSALSPIISFGLLFVIERTFSFTSVLSIDEFNDLNNDILNNLNEIANGTYSHSINVGALAEKCANQIHADSEFCKVAAYYHDLGKISRPEYFAENIDPKVKNKHDSISPYASAKIIIEHVTNGVELAHKYKLPEKIINIIREHHGTTILNHFYQKAVTQDGYENVDKSKFIYPGPIPQSKESAIIMICDQVEAISRLPADKRGETDRMIDEVIENMLNQNQFDDSKITIKDLKIIKQTLIKQLSGMTHNRVEYQKEFNKR